MVELKSTRAESVTVPKRVRRYCVAYYTEYEGWRNSFEFSTTPETALDKFFRIAKGQSGDYAPKFYTVYELDLEIPITLPDTTE